MSPVSLFDLHIHTRAFSTCASASADEVLHAALRMGLDGIALTEHDAEWPPDQIQQIQRRLGAAQLLVVIGQEVRAWDNGRLAGDFLCYGFHRPINHNFTPEELIEAVHAEGGVIIPAHPFRAGLGIGERLFDLSVDAIEVFSSNTTPSEQELARAAAEKMGLPQIAASDAHEARLVGSYLTAFEDPIETETDLIQAIRSARCQPYPPRLL